MQCIKRWAYGSKRRIEKIKRKYRDEQKGILRVFEIPYMTETDWELGNRRVPPYLLRLMEYKIRIEQLADKKNQEKTEDKR